MAETSPTSSESQEEQAPAVAPEKSTKTPDDPDALTAVQKVQREKVETANSTKQQNEALKGVVAIQEALKNTKSPLFQRFRNILLNSPALKEIRTTLRPEFQPYAENVRLVITHALIEDISQYVGNETILNILEKIANTKEDITEKGVAEVLDQYTGGIQAISTTIESKINISIDAYVAKIKSLPEVSTEEERQTQIQLFQNTASLLAFLNGKSLDEALKETQPINLQETKNNIKTFDRRAGNISNLAEKVLDVAAGSGVFGEAILKFIKDPPISTILAFFLGIKTKEEFDNYLDSEVSSRKSFAILLSFGKDKERIEGEDPIPFLEKVDMKKENGEPITRIALKNFYEKIKEWRVPMEKGFWQTIFTNGELEFTVNNKKKRMIFPGLREMIEENRKSGKVFSIKKITGTLNAPQIEDIPDSKTSTETAEKKTETPPRKFEDLEAGEKYEFVGVVKGPSEEQKKAKIDGTEVTKVRTIREKGKPETEKEITSIGGKIYTWNAEKKEWKPDEKLVINAGTTIAEATVNLTGKPAEQKTEEAPKPAESQKPAETTEKTENEEKVLEEAFKKATTFPFTYTKNGKEMEVGFSPETKIFSIGEKKYQIRTEGFFGGEISKISGDSGAITLENSGMFSGNKTFAKGDFPLVQIFRLQKGEKFSLTQNGSTVAVFESI